MESTIIDFVKEETRKMKEKVKEEIDNLTKKVALNKQILDGQGFIEHIEDSTTAGFDEDSESKDDDEDEVSPEHENKTSSKRRAL